MHPQLPNVRVIGITYTLESATSKKENNGLVLNIILRAMTKLFNQNNNTF